MDVVNFSFVAIQGVPKKSAFWNQAFVGIWIPYNYYICWTNGCVNRIIIIITIIIFIFIRVTRITEVFFSGILQLKITLIQYLAMHYLQQHIYTI